MVCWDAGDYGLSTECDHFYCSTCLAETFKSVMDQGWCMGRAPRAGRGRALVSAVGARHWQAHGCARPPKLPMLKRVQHAAPTRAFCRF